MEARAPHRDEAWFDGLYRRRERALTGYCARRVGPVDAQDAVSQVFVVVWRRREDVPPTDRELPWLYGVARRVVSHHWRTRGRQANLSDRMRRARQFAPATPDNVVVERREHQLVREAVAGLRAVDREVLLLSAWEGLSHREIARALGCSKDAIDKRMARAKNRLAESYTTLTHDSATSPVSAPRGGTGR